MHLFRTRSLGRRLKVPMDVYTLSPEGRWQRRAFPNFPTYFYWTSIELYAYFDATCGPVRIPFRLCYADQ
jgi:hypothetical protein